ncbi:lantibiotic dehydratase [Actinomadura monticuli]|uniref:Lantibiotic dehydratase n=1 Tax=Actinomadura monticuli TaxID=3097367 RepID=A0ABV4Q4M8_9ACTN
MWRIAAVRSAGFPFALLETLTKAHGEDEFVRSPRFLAALTWQNPGLLTNWMSEYAAALGRGERTHRSRPRRRAELIARYAQRYCAKNDTIGFFGAVAWAHFTDTGPDLRWSGTGLLRRHSVHLETWAAEAIAAAWRERPDLQDELPVRRVPSSSLGPGGFVRAQGSVSPLSRSATGLLAALDTHDRCGDVIRAAAAALPEYTADELMADLWELDRRGMVQLGFLIPCDAHPERHLRRHVAGLPASHPARAELMERLDALDRAHVRLAGTPPDTAPSALAAALSEADQALGSLSGAPLRRRPEAPTRRKRARAGPVLGRTSHYLDSRRDLDVTLGPGLRERLAGPLALVLDSARWLAAEIGDEVERMLHARFKELSRGTEPVSLGRLQFSAADVLSGARDWTDAIVEDFRLRWAECLPTSGRSEIAVRATDVAPRFDALFPPRRPRWAAARQHSPDLLLARRPGGRSRWVLGELHIGLNTLESRVFVTQADVPDELRDLTAWDHRSGRIVPLYPSDSPEVTSRTYPPTALDPPGLYRYWSYGPDQGHPLGADSIPAAELTVHDRDGALFARHHRGGWQAPVLEFYGEFLTALAVDLFSPRAPAPHAPRTRIDDLVVCRESWHLAPADLPDRGDLNTWLHSRGIPRHVFVKTPAEPKPVYVDFASPPLVDNLFRVARRLHADAAPFGLCVTEMLPGPEDLWLTDAEGAAYTSEFRVVAVDPRDTPSIFSRES